MLALPLLYKSTSELKMAGAAASCRCHHLPPHLATGTALSLLVLFHMISLASPTPANSLRRTGRALALTIDSDVAGLVLDNRQQSDLRVQVQGLDIAMAAEKMLAAASTLNITLARAHDFAAWLRLENSSTCLNSSVVFNIDLPAALPSLGSLGLTPQRPASGLGAADANAMVGLSNSTQPHFFLEPPGAGDVLLTSLNESVLYNGQDLRAGVISLVARLVALETLPQQLSFILDAMRSSCAACLSQFNDTLPPDSDLSTPFPSELAAMLTSPPSTAQAQAALDRSVASTNAVAQEQPFVGLVDGDLHMVAFGNITFGSADSPLPLLVAGLNMTQVLGKTSEFLQALEQLPGIFATWSTPAQLLNVAASCVAVLPPVSACNPFGPTVLSRYPGPSGYFDAVTGTLDLVFDIPVAAVDVSISMFGTGATPGTLNGSVSLSPDKRAASWSPESPMTVALPSLGNGYNITVTSIDECGYSSNSSWVFYHGYLAIWTGNGDGFSWQDGR